MTRAIVVPALAVVSVSLFVAYCRWLLAKTSQRELGENLVDSITMGDGIVSSEDLGCLQALIRLCPLCEKNEAPIVAASAYSFLLKGLTACLSCLSKFHATGVDRELSRCAHFFAVRLDQRVANARKLQAEQISLQGKEKDPR